MSGIAAPEVVCYCEFNAKKLAITHDHCGANVNPVAETSALLNLLVSAMVQDRDAVKVTTVSGLDSSIVFVLEVAQKDRGKVLGKQGKMAQSLRLILRSIGKENGMIFFLDVPEAAEKAAA